MANTPSAKKRIRQNERYALVNKNRISRIRTFIKKVEAAITSAKAPEALEAFKIAQPEIQRGVTKGVIHKNTAARKISRLLTRIKALAS